MSKDWRHISKYRQLKIIRVPSQDLFVWTSSSFQFYVFFGRLVKGIHDRVEKASEALPLLWWPLTQRKSLGNRIAFHFTFADSEMRFISTIRIISSLGYNSVKVSRQQRRWCIKSFSCRKWAQNSELDKSLFLIRLRVLRLSRLSSAFKFATFLLWRRLN